uniref:Uncharacterized protein n=1 Tax=Romanomermis culicivorax TaxID=13658 RepID=A0A915HZ72_ROMCU
MLSLNFFAQCAALNFHEFQTPFVRRIAQSFQLFNHQVHGRLSAAHTLGHVWRSSDVYDMRDRRAKCSTKKLNSPTHRTSSKIKQGKLRKRTSDLHKIRRITHVILDIPLKKENNS